MKQNKKLFIKKIPVLTLIYLVSASNTQASINNRTTKTEPQKSQNQGQGGLVEEIKGRQRHSFIQDNSQIFDSNNYGQNNDLFNSFDDSKMYDSNDIMSVFTVSQGSEHSSPHESMTAHLEQDHATEYATEHTTEYATGSLDQSFENYEQHPSPHLIQLLKTTDIAFAALSQFIQNIQKDINNINFIYGARKTPLINTLIVEWINTKESYNSYKAQKFLHVHEAFDQINYFLDHVEKYIPKALEERKKIMQSLKLNNDQPNLINDILADLFERTRKELNFLIKAFKSSALESPKTKHYQEYLDSFNNNKIQPIIEIEENMQQNEARYLIKNKIQEIKSKTQNPNQIEIEYITKIANLFKNEILKSIDSIMRLVNIYNEKNIRKIDINQNDIKSNYKNTLEKLDEIQQKRNNYSDFTVYQTEINQILTELIENVHNARIKVKDAFVKQSAFLRTNPSNIDETRFLNTFTTALNNLNQTITENLAIFNKDISNQKESTAASHHLNADMFFDKERKYIESNNDPLVSFIRTTATNLNVLDYENKKQEKLKKEPKNSTTQHGKQSKPVKHTKTIIRDLFEEVKMALSSLVEEKKLWEEASSHYEQLLKNLEQVITLNKQYDHTKRAAIRAIENLPQFAHDTDEDLLTEIANKSESYFENPIYNALNRYTVATHKSLADAFSPPHFELRTFLAKTTKNIIEKANKYNDAPTNTVGFSFFKKTTKKTLSDNIKLMINELKQRLQSISSDLSKELDKKQNAFVKLFEDINSTIKKQKKQQSRSDNIFVGLNTTAMSRNNGAILTKTGAQKMQATDQKPLGVSVINTDVFLNADAFKIRLEQYRQALDAALDTFAKNRNELTEQQTLQSQKKDRNELTEQQTLQYQEEEKKEFNPIIGNYNLQYRRM